MRSRALLVALVGVACRDLLFPCAQNSDCEDGGDGLCQPEGVCSFPDDSCESGQRFGAHSGGLSNECVPPTNADGTSVATSSTGPGASVDDADPTLDGSGPGSSSGVVPLDDTAGASTTATEGGTTGDAVDPTLLLWFTFDHDSDGAIVNDGTLDGDAVCLAGACPLAIDDGAIGMAATFDGADDCAMFPFVDELNAAEFTLAVWVRRDVPGDTYDGVFTKPVGAGAFNTWRVSLQTPPMAADVVNVHVGLQDNSGVELQSTFVLGDWTHMAATWTGGELELFIDGASIGVEPSMLFEVDDHDVYLGCDEDTSNIVGFLSGSLDDVRMYSRVLDPTEIAELVALGGA